MRVFDFDNTIYNGESALDFYLFSIKYNPAVIKYVPVVFQQVIKYKTNKTTMEDLVQGFKKYAHSYITSFDNPEKLVIDFWDKKFHKIKSWYQPREDDIIITASFDVIMEEACKRLGVKNCISSRIDRETMTVSYINFNRNKLERFKEIYGDDAIIDEFYTDNYFDRPMIEASQTAYIVKGSKIKKIK